MKIVHLCISNFYVENMGYQENILPRKHKQQGHKVTIITTPYSFDYNGNSYERPVGIKYNEDGIPVIVLKYKKLPFKMARYLHYVDGLYSKLEEIKPDIIFSHGVSFFSIYELKYYCKKYKTRLFCDCHADYFNTTTKGVKYGIINGFFWPIVARTIIPYIEKAWGTTPARCEYLKTVYKFPSDKVDLLVMGGDEDTIPYKDKLNLRKNLCTEYNIPDDAFIICTGGKINKAKRVLELIKAVHSINKKNLYLIILGSVTNDIEIEFKELLVRDNRIIYLGWADQKKINESLVLCDLAIFPGTHSVLWEQAIACGTPTVFRKRELMTHVDVGGNCLFIKDANVQTITGVINRILFDKQLYERMQIISLTKGVETFSYGNIAKKAINN